MKLPHSPGFIYLVVAILAIPVFGSEPARPVLPTVSAAMRRLVDEHRMAGAVTLVARDGQILHCEAVGYRDLAAREPLKTDALFSICSMTKPIVATALMALVAENKIRLDDPVTRYLPEFSATVLASGRPPHRPVTVRDLLTHTSGFGGDQRMQGTLAETARAIAARRLAFEPGSKWMYSPGITVCGRIVEVVSGVPLEQFLNERIFKPLGMRDTTFRLTHEQEGRLAKLYRPANSPAGLEEADNWFLGPAAGRSPNPSGGLYSTAADLLALGSAMFAAPGSEKVQVLPAAIRADMLRIHTGDLPAGFTPGTGWGLGWCIVRQPTGVTQTLSPGSFGHGGLYGTQFWVDPKKRAIYILLLQRTGIANSDDSPMRRAFQAAAGTAIGD